MNTKPIFILGAHKSGTSLLRALLDGHPDLYVVPVEAHFFQNLSFWVDNEYRRQRPRKLTREEQYKRFADYIQEVNDKTDPYSDSVSKGIFDQSRFEEYFSRIHKGDPPQRLLALYLEAIHYSEKGVPLPEGLRVVEKSVENAEFVPELNRYYPEAKFVHILRNPYANLVSLRRYKSIGFGYPIMRRVLRTMENSYYWLYKNRRLMPSYRIIRYEDLVREPEKTMRELAEYLEIPFHQVLLAPTYRGADWQGNSITGQKFRGVETSVLNRWQDEILPLEVRYVNRLFPFVLRDYNYEEYTASGSFWRRAQGENLKRYLANRIFWYYLRDY